jgi:murein DD-endopeptidase MepM/ murein hydrolase activator NlpD
VEVLFDGRQIPLYRSVEGDWVGLLPAGLEMQRGENPVNILTWRGEEASPPQAERINIVWGSFLYQDIAVPNALAPLLDPTLNEQEQDTVLAAYRRFTPQKWWTGAFLPPVPGAVISEFGGIRNYNSGVLESRHTGTDYRAGLGEPTSAAGDGRVVFANFTQIRGNHIIIDHGVGVMTGYSHLSEVYVVPGQRVLAGDIIGAVGATGRTQGAHMHFEVVVNGAWVDPVQFLTLPIPEEAALPVLN